MGGEPSPRTPGVQAHRKAAPRFEIAARPRERSGGSLDAYTSREHTSFQARVLDRARLRSAAGRALATSCSSPSATRGRPPARARSRPRRDRVRSMTPRTISSSSCTRTRRCGTGTPTGHSILGTTRHREERHELSDRLREIHESRVLRRREPGFRRQPVDVDHDVHRRSRPRALFGSAAYGGVRPARFRRCAPPAGPLGETKHVERDGTLDPRRLRRRVVPEHAQADRHAVDTPWRCSQAAFGGGMSSRLFQRIREELAPVLTPCTAFQSFYSARPGWAGVYVGTRPECADLAVEADAPRNSQRLARERASATEELRRSEGAGERTDHPFALESHELRGSTGSRRFALYEEPFLSLGRGARQRIDRGVDRRRSAEAAREFTYDRTGQLALRLGPPS